MRPAKLAVGVEGHRARLRARFLAGGAEAVADHELIEMVLFLALPRRDTKPIARGFAGAVRHLCRRRFPRRVPDLLAVEGLGEAGVAALKMVQAAAQRLAQGGGAVPAGAEQLGPADGISASRAGARKDRAVPGAVSGQPQPAAGR